MSDKTDYPVHDQLDVIDGETIFKNDGWWKAVVVCDAWNGNEVSVYLWQEQDDVWKRKQKFKISGESEWDSTRKKIDQMVDKHIVTENEEE